MSRICFFLPALAGGGAERVTLTIAGGLEGRGYDVDLVLGQRRGPLADDIPSGLKVVDLDRARVSRAVGALREYLKRERPAAVVSALFHANLAALVASRGLTVPVLVVEHNTMSVKFGEASGWRDRLAPLACRVAYRWADQVAAVSDGVADDMSERLGLPRRDVLVLRNPVDYAEIRRRAAEPPDHPWLSDKKSPVVLAVGRLTAQKDFPTLIRAVALLPTDVRLLVLGDGEEREALVRLADDLGVAERVAVHGFVGNPYPYFAAADVVAMSSRWEGLPTVLLEALPFPARIVATDCKSGPREILEDGKYGRLVPVGAVEDLATAIGTALDEAAPDRSAAIARYDVSAALNGYDAAIRGLLGQGRSVGWES